MSALTESPPAAVDGRLSDPVALRVELSKMLASYQDLARTTPSENPVRRVVHDMIRRLSRDELTVADLEALIQHLTVRAFQFRAKRLAEYVGECAIETNAHSFRNRILGLTRDDLGNTGPFGRFAERIERELFGIVITAHPTFNISPELTGQLARLATGFGDNGVRLDEGGRAAVIEDISHHIHGRKNHLTLGEELSFAQDTITNIQGALRRVYDIILDVAAEVYPEEWCQLTPRLMTVASWVGYDMDGRADITWYQTFAARLKAESIQLDRYLQRLRVVAALIDERGETDDAVRVPMKLIEGRLVQAHATLVDELATLTRLDGDPDEVARFSKRLAATRETRLVDAAELIGPISLMMGAVPSAASKRDLSILRAEMANYGLDMSHVHFRINATQLLNAVRKQVGLDSAPDDPGNRRRYLRSLNAMLDDVEPESINFGSIIGETTSARRMFMLITQILKYADRHTPIRFLIAECDTAFAVLTALYFARLFGISDRLDISPLFETAEALQHGHEIIADLLDNEHYRAYVHKRGRLCIQTGFSDAGRYVGQAAASLAIERIRLKLGKLLAEKGMQGIELVIFDTHGESIGRGAHPVSFKDRLDYTYPPRCRLEFACAGVPVKQELSFQGGDGYVYFATPELAFATVCRLLEHALESPDNACDVTEIMRKDDWFYEDTDYSLEFFITVKNYNERMMEDPSYAAVLNAFGTNLLYATGSRKSKRQYDTKTSIDTAHPSQIRAIPHNGILQQMGFLANSVCGVGKAMTLDRDRFAEVFAHSERLRDVMALSAYAYELSSLDSFAAYLDLFDPVSWLHIGMVETDENRRERVIRLSRLMHETRRHERLRRMLRVFLQESMNFETGLRALGKDVELVPKLVHDCHPDLELLHAVRIVLIHQLLMLVSRIPRFSSQPDVTIDDVIAELLHLDVKSAVATLQKAFPMSSQAFDEGTFGEQASYRTEAELGYDQENRELFLPMLDLYDLVRRTSTGIAHIMGAVG